MLQAQELRGKTTLRDHPEGSGGKELTGDSYVEVKEFEEIENNGDTAITPTDGNNELEEAEEAKHLAQRAFARMERMDPRIAGIQIELDSNQFAVI
eukprot:jgi/Tetstr1/446047/TSEL_033649.t1